MRGLLAAGALLLSVAGCIPHYVVPEPLYRQVDQSVSFSQLTQDAARHKGASVMLGGAVLGAKTLPEGTEIEVLHLPLDASDRPGSAEYSEGRFLLLDPERRDPAVLQRRLITVVGEVVGAKVGKIDEVDYAYPYLSARFIHVWRSTYDYPPDAAYPYYYPYRPYAPYYPYLYGDFLFWSVPRVYYGPVVGPTPRGPAIRRFEPPTGGAPEPSPPPPLPSPPSRDEGAGRRFK